jgi:hypothetical protein
MNMAEYLKSQRTTTQEQVDANARKHDADSYKPQERMSTNG